MKCEKSEEIVDETCSGRGMKKVRLADETGPCEFGPSEKLEEEDSCLDLGYEIRGFV
jgi:hypothetical protein